MQNLTHIVTVHVRTEKAVATLSSEVMGQLDRLMVEADLLQVEVNEQDSLRRVLVACDVDCYGAKVFEFEV